MNTMSRRTSREEKVLAIVALFLFSGALIFLFHVSIPLVGISFLPTHVLLGMAATLTLPIYFLMHFIPYVLSGNLMGQVSFNVPPRLTGPTTTTIIPDATGTAPVYWLYNSRNSTLQSYSTYDSALTAALAVPGQGSVLTLSPSSTLTVTTQQTLPAGWALEFEPGTQITLDVTAGTASAIFTTYYPWILCKGGNTIVGGEFIATAASYQAPFWVPNVSTVNVSGATLNGGSEGILAIWENTTTSPIQSLGIVDCIINGGAGSLGYGMTGIGGHLEGLTFTGNEIVTSTAGGGEFASPSTNAGAIVSWEITGNAFTNFSTAPWTALYFSNSAGAYGTSVTGNSFVNLSTATNYAAQWIEVSITGNQRASLSIDGNSFDSVTAPAGNVGVLRLAAGWGVSFTGNDVDGGASNVAPNSSVTAVVTVTMADVTNLFRCSDNDITYNLGNHIYIQSNQTELTFTHNWLISGNILNKCYNDSVRIEPNGSVLGLINVTGNRIADMNLSSTANIAGIAFNRINSGSIYGPVVVENNGINTMDFTPSATTYGIFLQGTIGPYTIGFNPAYQQSQAGGTTPVVYNHYIAGQVYSSATYGQSTSPDGLSLAINPIGTISFQPVSLGRGAYPYLRYLPFYPNLVRQAELYLNTANSTISQANTGALAVRPDGKEVWVLEASPTAQIAIIDAHSLAVTGTIAVGTTTGNNSIVFSPDGRYAYVADSGSAGIWKVNVSTHTVSALVSSGLGTISMMAISPDGLILYAGSSGSDSFYAINTQSGASVASLVVSGGATADTTGTPVVTPDGTLVYVPVANKNVVSYYEVNNNFALSNISVGTTPIGAALTPDGRYLYVANNGSTNVSVIDTSTQAVTATITLGAAPNRVWATTDGLWVYVSTTAGLSVIQVSTNTVFTTIAQADVDNGVVQITPNGELAFMASSAGSVYIFNIATNNLNAQDLTAQTTTSTTLATLATAGSLSFTPGFTGKVRVIAKVRGSNNTATDGWTAALLNGSTVLDQQSRTDAVANSEQSVDFYTIVSVTAGTTVTMNLQFAAVTGGTASVKVTEFEITPII